MSKISCFRWTLKGKVSKTSYFRKNSETLEVCCKIGSNCSKKLKKGGTLSVCVPDARLYIDAYISGEKFVDFYDKSLVCPSTVCDTGSPIDQVNLIAYLGGQHCYMFDKVNLVNILKRNGFSQVKLRGFEEGLDLKERDHESIYALAIK